MTPTLTPNRLEHANLTVADIDRSARLLRALLPHWQVRGSGLADTDAGPTRWLHLGDDFQYVALYAAAPGAPPPRAGGNHPVNHLGLVVDDVEAALARAAAEGVPLDHIGGATTHRRSAYLRLVPEGLEIELVQYTSAVPGERNVYAAPD